MDNPQLLSDSQRSDIEECCNLLSNIHSVSEAIQIQRQIIIKAYRLCRAEVDRAVLSEWPDLEKEWKLMEQTYKEDHATSRILLKGYLALDALVSYAKAPGDVKDEDIVLQLHQNLVNILPILRSKAHTRSLDQFSGVGLSRPLAKACQLSRALDVLLSSAYDCDNERVSTQGIRCEWISRPRNQVSSVQVTFDNAFFTRLQSRFPELLNISLSELLERITKKLGLYPPTPPVGIIENTDTFTVTVPLREHCEVTLISTLADRNVASSTYIACALPVCFLCHMFVMAINEAQSPVKYDLGVFDDAFDLGWQFPTQLPLELADKVKDAWMDEYSRIFRAASHGYKRREHLRAARLEALQSQNPEVLEWL